MRAIIKGLVHGTLAFLCARIFISIDIYANDRKDVVLEVQLELFPRFTLLDIKTRYSRLILSFVGNLL